MFVFDIKTPKSIQILIKMPKYLKTAKNKQKMRFYHPILIVKSLKNPGFLRFCERFPVLLYGVFALFLL